MLKFWIAIGILVGAGLFHGIGFGAGRKAQRSAMVRECLAWCEATQGEGDGSLCLCDDKGRTWLVETAPCVEGIGL